VFRFLQAEGLLSQGRTRLLLSWRHSGFSVHTSVTVPPDDRDGLERLARYLLRPPVSLERLRVDEDAQAIAYAGRRRGGAGHEPRVASAPLDPKEFPARVLMHIPEPRRHVIRYYGAYSSVVRARRARQAVAAGGGGAAAPLSIALEPASLEWRTARRRWAQLIRRIYEVDPLVCPRCGGGMRIIAFVTEPRVIGTILRHLEAKGVDARSPPGAPGDADVA